MTRPTQEPERVQWCERCEVWITWENALQHNYCALSGCISTWERVP